MVPAGPEKGVGVITSNYGKDATDPAWANDPGMNEWRAFMKKYLPDADMKDNNYVYAYGVSMTMLQALKQCKGDFSRANIMKQAANLKDSRCRPRCRESRSTPARPTTIPSARCSCSAGTARPGCASAT